jgi:hypothetical protein
MSGAAATLDRPTTSATSSVQGTRTTGLPDSALLSARPRAAPDPWDRIFTDLNAIRRLEDNWDGLGAPAPKPALVGSAFQLAQYFRQEGKPAPSRVVAGLNGTVLFEWQGEGSYTEVEITAPYHGEGMTANVGQPTRHWEVRAQAFGAELQDWYAYLLL